jgi:hypothetical protein
MPGANEVGEEIEHAGRENKGIALLIAVLALFLSFAATGGKGAQTEAITENVESGNLWAFYQAKAIRGAMLATAAEAMEADVVGGNNPAIKAAKERTIETWRKTAARYDSEPETKEGKKELAERAKIAEEHRDNSMAKYHNFELASAALEIGIVLASAAIITGMIVLAWIAGGLGGLGLAFIGIALFAPHAVHLF